jgi:hypothetical protein
MDRLGARVVHMGLLYGDKDVLAWLRSLLRAALDSADTRLLANWLGSVAGRPNSAVLVREAAHAAALRPETVAHLQTVMRVCAVEAVAMSGAIAMALNTTIAAHNGIGATAVVEFVGRSCPSTALAVLADALHCIAEARPPAELSALLLTVHAAAPALHADAMRVAETIVVCRRDANLLAQLVHVEMSVGNAGELAARMLVAASQAHWHDVFAALVPEMLGHAAGAAAVEAAVRAAIANECAACVDGVRAVRSALKGPRARGRRRARAADPLGGRVHADARPAPPAGVAVRPDSVRVRPWRRPRRRRRERQRCRTLCGPRQ